MVIADLPTPPSPRITCAAAEIQMWEAIWKEKRNEEKERRAGRRGKEVAESGKVRTMRRSTICR